MERYHPPRFSGQGNRSEVAFNSLAVSKAAPCYTLLASSKEKGVNTMERRIAVLPSPSASVQRRCWLHRGLRTGAPASLAVPLLNVSNPVFSAWVGNGGVRGGMHEGAKKGVVSGILV